MITMLLQICIGILFLTMACSSTNKNPENKTIQTVEDHDNDGIPSDQDCDDNDPRVPAEDLDCDGLYVDEDCNDFDATSINDMDCDGVATADDCDDSDPLLAMDMDNNGGL